MKHECAPKAWRKVDMRTGDYDFDASLTKVTNGDAPKRLKLYMTHDDPDSFYSYRTGYGGYGGYSGDD